MHDESPCVDLSRDARGIGLVTLNRPDRHNALAAPLVAALDAALLELEADAGVRVVVLAGHGRSFCAGADIGEMRAAGAGSERDNAREAGRLAALLQRLDRLPKPTVARIHGNAFGGALGLIAACDVAIAAQGALFAFSEVRLGIVPAMIAPYALRAIGERQARRYFLTGERFDAATAERIGLVHGAVPAAQLDAAVAGVTGALLAGAPGAQAEAKLLIRKVTGRSDAGDGQLARETAGWIARLRAAAEGREGLSAFLEKRDPAWQER